MIGQRAKVWIGSLLLLGTAAGAVWVVSAPRFRRPVSRVVREALSGVVARQPTDLVVVPETFEGVQVGAPVYFVDDGGDARAIAHVVSRRAELDGAPALRLRFSADEAPGGPWRLRVFPPRRGLVDAVGLAVPDDVADALSAELTARLRELWDGALEPAVRKRLPAFLDRLDPRTAEASKHTLGLIGGALFDHLRPHLNGLMDDVTRAVDRHYDLLDRMGLLWKFVRGDRKGLKREVLPVAERAAREWWARNQAPVMDSVGAAVKARMPELRRFLETEVLSAAREELLEPVIREQQRHIAKEAERALREVVRQVVEAPSGGFRVRFAGVLRHVLLQKKTAVLLLERVEPDA
jgi:hypothetical protein